MPRTQSPKINKSEFIRSMPDAPAREVVEAGAKKGVKLSEKYVHVIRSADKARARVGKAVGGGKRGRGRGASSGSEAELRRAIAELGLTRARQVLGEVEAAFSR
jgi:hypothetical protein